MPRNGSGTFNLTYDWEADRDAGIKIRADRHKAQDQEFADAFTASLAKDGQTVPTANLPMGNFKHTGVADGTARTHYASVGQMQDAGPIYAAATGTDTYAITPSPAITAYAVGQEWEVKIANANATTTPTLNVSGIGAGTITCNGGQAVPIGALAANSHWRIRVTAATPTFEIVGMVTAPTNAQTILANQVFS